MGELADDWRAWNKDKKERRADRATRNRTQLDQSGLEFTESGHALLFREEGKPKVDFYPSTGVWLYTAKGKRKKNYGTAESFINWYAKQ